MKRIALWVSIVVIILAVIAGLWAWLSPAPGTTTNNPPDVEFPTAGTQPEGIPAIAIPTTTGSFEIKDPKIDPAAFHDPYNEDYYYLGYHIQEGPKPDPTATAKPPYVIQYSESTRFFNVALLSEPIGKVRKDAEFYLMQHLNISEAQMCGLNYTVAVPHWVSEQYTATDLRFSFCKGAVVLPE